MCHTAWHVMSASYVLLSTLYWPTGLNLAGWIDHYDSILMFGQLRRKVWCTVRYVIAFIPHPTHWRPAPGVWIYGVKLKPWAEATPPYSVGTSQVEHMFLSATISLECEQIQLKKSPDPLPNMVTGEQARKKKRERNNSNISSFENVCLKEVRRLNGSSPATFPSI